MRTREETLQFQAPLAGEAWLTLEDGRRPSDVALRGGLREVRSIRRQLAGKNIVPSSLESVTAILDDLIDVFRWALRQPLDVAVVLCSNCGRRPRHFDDLCKRCGAETRPRGRIGT